MLAIAAVLTLATAAKAAPIIGGSGLSAPATTITFSEVAVANGAVVTSQFSAFGVTFGSLSATEGLYYSSGAGLLNYFPDTYNPFSIQFNGPVSDAAFLMITNGSTDVFTALLNGSVVNQFSSATGGWKYFGFAGIVFDEIQVDFTGPANGPHMRLDNLQFEPVPIPAALPLMAAGIGGLALLARRRK